MLEVEYTVAAATAGIPLLQRLIVYRPVLAVVCHERVEIIVRRQTSVTVKVGSSVFAVQVHAHPVGSGFPAGVSVHYQADGTSRRHSQVCDFVSGEDAEKSLISLVHGASDLIGVHHDQSICTFRSRLT